MGDFGRPRGVLPSQGKAKILAKIDLCFGVSGVCVMGILILLFVFAPSLVYDYSSQNPNQKDLQNFLLLEGDTQWTLLGIYFGWNFLELGLAVLLGTGTNHSSFALLRTWMILTVLNFLVGLLTSAVLVYPFTMNKTSFLLFALAIYSYKLFSIYTVDSLLRELLEATGQKV